MRLTIERMSDAGDGLADGIAVTFALPGETVEAEVLEGRGQLSAVITASAERIAPVCPHFGDCGGCRLQHWRADAVADWKRGLITRALARRGLAVEAGPLVDAHGAGRRRVTLHVRTGPEGSRAGFMAARSHRLVAIEACPVLAPALAQAPAIAARVGAIISDCDVTLVASAHGLDLAVKAERKTSARLAPKLAELARTAELCRVALNGEVVAALKSVILRVGPADVPLPLGGFLQATAAGEEALAGFALSHLKGRRRIADLFSGIGPFALRLSAEAQVTAMDSDGAALEALQSAHRNTPGLKPIAVTRRNLFREPLTAQELGGFDAALFDPPRAGAEAQCRQFARSALTRIVAIACDPASFARDAAILTAGGFRLETVMPVDQFRYSAHVELAALFTR